MKRIPFDPRGAIEKRKPVWEAAILDHMVAGCLGRHADAAAAAQSSAETIRALDALAQAAQFDGQYDPPKEPT